MSELTETFRQEVRDFVTGFQFGNDLSGSRFLVTGSTGLIGSTLIHCLLALHQDIHFILPVRDVQKALQSFDEASLPYIDAFQYDLLTYDYSGIDGVDYIIHCASPTNGKYFTEHPLDTFNVITVGTRHLLEYASQHPVRGFVFLSSIEVYGQIYDEDTILTEDIQGYLDSNNARNSYPLAKREAESLCRQYATCHGVPVSIARLTLTTGQCITESDSRIINQFSRLASVGHDIILYSSGKSSRPYCYSIDAVTGILTILLRGKAGEAYNIANAETYMSAYCLAEYVRHHFAPSISVRIAPDESKGYAPDTYILLSTEKIEALGWKPKYSLYTIIHKMIEYYNDRNRTC